MLKWLRGLGPKKLPTTTFPPAFREAHFRPRFRDAIIMRSLELSGVAHSQPKDVAFIVAAIGHLMFWSALDIRRHGTRLPKERLREIGMRPNAHCTQEFLDILNEQGIRDPMLAADIIAGVLRAGANWLITVRPWMRGERNDKLWFCESNFAAGPCDAAAQLTGVRATKDTALPLPLRECTHPDQCGCRYYSARSD